jgi:hypothetical protein
MSDSVVYFSEYLDRKLFSEQQRKIMDNCMPAFTFLYVILLAVIMSFVETVTMFALIKIYKF